MERLKGWNLFIEIKQYKKMGLNKSQIQRTLNINYKTELHLKYLTLFADEF